MLRISLLIFTGIVSSVLAAQGEECADALIVSTYSRNSQLNSDWRLSQFVSEDHFKQIKRSFSGEAVVYGIPMKGSYEDYKSASDRKIRQSSERLTREQKDNLLWTGLDSNSLQAYEACLQSKGYGLYLYPRKATRDQVELRLEYRPTNPSSGKIDLSWPGAPTSMRLPSQIAAFEQRTVIVGRPREDQQILLAVNGAGLTAPAIVITAYPSPSPPAATPKWQSSQVTMRDPVFNKGEPGIADLPDGYSIRNIRYRHVGPGPGRHEFKFDVYGPAGRLRADVVYAGDGRTPWEGRTETIRIEDHVMRYAFSDWNDNLGRFRYIWDE